MREFSFAVLLSCLVIETCYIATPYISPAEASLGPTGVTVVEKNQDRIPQQIAISVDTEVVYPPVLDLAMDIPTEAVVEESLANTPTQENIFQQYKKRQAEIVEPARPGMVWIKTVSGVRAIVAERYAKSFVGFLQDLEDTGYKINDVGGYVYRRIAGRHVLSKHAFGAAIDVNQEERNIVSVPMKSALVSTLASKHGLCSGGDWRRSPDLGHFEVCGRPDRGNTRYAKTEKRSRHYSVRFARYRHYRGAQQRTADVSAGYHDVAAYH